MQEKNTELNYALTNNNFRWKRSIDSEVALTSVTTTISLHIYGDCFTISSVSVEDRVIDHLKYCFVRLFRLYLNVTALKLQL